MLENEEYFPSWGGQGKEGYLFSSHQDGCNSTTSSVFVPVELKIGVNAIVVKSSLAFLPRGLQWGNYTPLQLMVSLYSSILLYETTFFLFFFF